MQNSLLLEETKRTLAEARVTGSTILDQRANELRELLVREELVRPYGKILEPSLRYGLNISPGWIHLLTEVCEGAKSLMVESDMACLIAITRVKEKFGGLRIEFLVFSRDAERNKYGVPELLPEHKSFAERFNQIVIRAESRSYSTCEVCGKDAEEQRTVSGWIYTACNEHRRIR